MKDFMKCFRNRYNIEYGNITQQKSTTLKCGYCGMTIAPNRGYQINATYSHGETRLIGHIYVCPNCKNPIFYFHESAETVPGLCMEERLKISLPIFRHYTMSAVPAMQTSAIPRLR